MLEVLVYFGSYLRISLTVIVFAEAMATDGLLARRHSMQHLKKFGKCAKHKAESLRYSLR